MFQNTRALHGSTWPRIRSRPGTVSAIKNRIGVWGTGPQREEGVVGWHTRGHGEGHAEHQPPQAGPGAERRARRWVPMARHARAYLAGPRRRAREPGAEARQARTDVGGGVRGTQARRRPGDARVQRPRRLAAGSGRVGQVARARASPALGCGSPEAGFSPQQALSQAPTPRTRHASSAATPERRSHHSVSFDDAPPTERLRGFAAPRRPVAAPKAGWRTK